MKIAVCVSGGGRSLSNLLKRQIKMPFEIKLVISSRQGIGANEIATTAGLPLSIADFSLRNQVNAKEFLYSEFKRHEIDLVVLAGFLKLFPVDTGWRRKIINIHPALLPKFGGKGMYGMNVHNAVIAAGESVSGATVHYVNELFDDGDLIAQTHVTVRPGETPESLSKRVFNAECELLPLVLSELASGALPQKNNVLVFSESGVRT